MRNLKLAAFLIFAATVSRGSVLYTFQNTAANPYTFSLLEPTFLTTAGSFSIPAFMAGGQTYTQAALGFSGADYCFSFATAGGGAFPCSVSSGSPSGAGLISLFTNASAPGTYNASVAATVGLATAAPNQLTITTVPDTVLYTFLHTGTSPYSFSFLEPGILAIAGAFFTPPFTVDGNTYTQAALGFSGADYCFSFATAGGGAFPCSVSSGSPSGAGFIALFANANGPGTYPAVLSAPVGLATGTPDLLIIQVIPEPSTWLPATTGIALLALFAARRKRSIWTH